MSERGPSASFLRAICGSFPGFEVSVEENRSRDWISATFAGARHRLKLRVAGEGARTAAERFVDRLRADEFPLHGQFVAEIADTAIEDSADGSVRVSVEALIVKQA